MALIQRVDRFKNISNETDIGGAPFFADDFIRLQVNQRAEILNYYEFLRAKLPDFNYYQGPGNPTAPNFESGLIVSGLEYDNTNTALPVVSEGYIYSGGELLYYPGGTITAIGGSFSTLLYLYKGASTFTTRVFDDGGTKQFLESPQLVTEVGKYGVNGPEMPAGTGITATDQVVVLEIGNNSNGAGEKFFSTQSALGCIDFGVNLTRKAFTGVINLDPNVTLNPNRPYLGSRTTVEGMTEIHGSIIINDPGTTTILTCCRFVDFNQWGNGSESVMISAQYIDNTFAAGNIAAFIDTTGNLIIYPPGGLTTSWPTFLKVDIDVKICNTNQGLAYDYKEKFLDIT